MLNAKAAAPAQKDVVAAEVAAVRVQRGEVHLEVVVEDADDAAQVVAAPGADVALGEDAAAAAAVAEEMITSLRTRLMAGKFTLEIWISILTSALFPTNVKNMAA